MKRCCHICKIKTIIQRNLINPATITRTYFLYNLSLYECNFILKIIQLLDAIVLNSSYVFRKGLI